MTDLAKGEATVVKLRKMRTTDDDEDEASGVAADTAGRPTWMTALKTHAEEWLSSLPQSLTALSSSSGPLNRYFLRENRTGKKLLNKVRGDLEHLKGACEGTVKQTNELRSLMSDLNKGEFEIQCDEESSLTPHQVPCLHRGTSTRWRRESRYLGSSTTLPFDSSSSRLSPVEESTMGYGWVDCSSQRPILPPQGRRWRMPRDGVWRLWC